MTVFPNYIALPHHLDELMKRLERKELAGTDPSVSYQSFLNGEDLGELIFKCVSQLIQDYNAKKVWKPKVSFLLNKVMVFLEDTENKKILLPDAMQAGKIRTKISEL